ncbi:MAG: heavy-metal-associated domain-containing protein, partial [Selenomonas sp.]|nr:heavy-metal-associated domain-containing protein [Selenomonas sp.]
NQERQVSVGKEGIKMAMETELKIEGMMCAHCQKHVNDALSKMVGVTAVEVNLEAGTAKVTAEREISRAEFAEVITAAGYELVG